MNTVTPLYAPHPSEPGGPAEEGAAACRNCRQNQADQQQTMTVRRDRLVCLEDRVAALAVVLGRSHGDQIRAQRAEGAMPADLPADLDGLNSDPRSWQQRLACDIQQRPTGANPPAEPGTSYSCSSSARLPSRDLPRVLGTTPLSDRGRSGRARPDRHSELMCASSRHGIWSASRLRSTSSDRSWPARRASRRRPLWRAERSRRRH